MSTLEDLNLPQPNPPFVVYVLRLFHSRSDSSTVSIVDSRLTRSPIGPLLVNCVVKLDIPANRLFAGLGVRRQDFQNLPPLIFLRFGVVNHRVCVRDHLRPRSDNPDSEP